jgi:hypothetical protein
MSTLLRKCVDSSRRIISLPILLSTFGICSTNSKSESSSLSARSPWVSTILNLLVLKEAFAGTVNVTDVLPRSDSSLASGYRFDHTAEMNPTGLGVVSSSPAKSMTLSFIPSASITAE